MKRWLRAHPRLTGNGVLLVALLVGYGVNVLIGVTWAYGLIGGLVGLVVMLSLNVLLPRWIFGEDADRYTL